MGRPPAGRLCEPAATIIRMLGGAEVVAESSGVCTSAPYRWQSEKKLKGTGGYIPYKHHAALLRLARKRGVKLDPQDFSIVA